MKVIKLSKFKSYNVSSFEVSSESKDNDVKVCNITPLYIEVPDVSISIYNGTGVIKCNEELQDVINNIEQSIISSLVENSESVFGKQFDKEKFENGLVSSVKNGKFCINVCESSKLFSKDLTLYEDVSELAIHGDLTFRVSSISFYKSKFTVSFELVFFKELLEYQSDTDSIIVESCSDNENLEKDDNFF